MMNIRPITAFVDSSPAPNTSNPNHIYRLPPSLEVDRAWDRIAAADGVYPVSSADVARMGKDPAGAVKAPDSWGFPPEKSHMMGIEGFHQLHCLNALRKALITNYDHYWGSTYGFEPPITFARHLNHCTDILRQHLMCHADLEAFTFDWREGQNKPYADFEIKKTCVDFDYLLEWMETHRNPRHAEVWRLLEKPEDVLQKEAPLDLPQVTDETMWSADGKYPLAAIPDLEGKEYCLGH